MKTFGDPFSAGRRDEEPPRKPRAVLHALRNPLEYRKLVERLEGPLSKFVSGFIRDRHAREDLVQETFLRVFRNLHRYRGQASLKSWIFSIARNLCLDHLRASGRSRLRLLQTLPSTEHDKALMRQAVPDSRCPEPARLAELDESRALVEQALTRLSPEAKSLLVFRLYLGLSYREIARRCNVRPAGIGTRISRALRGLSKRLP